MTLSLKLEVLGQVSERARDVEVPGDVPEDEFAHAAALLRTARQSGSWVQLREALVLLLAIGVNWILVGDRLAPAPAALDPGLDYEQRVRCADRPVSPWR